MGLKRLALAQAGLFIKSFRAHRAFISTSSFVNYTSPSFFEPVKRLDRVIGTFGPGTYG